jgi:tetratricopeptide (TPR) repeat protein
MSASPISFFARSLAWGWYLWGLSWAQWGVYATEQTYYRWGIQSFDRALQCDPTFARAFFRRGLIRGRELNQIPEALADLTRASELAPQWAEPYLQRGLLLRFHGDLATALPDLRRFVTLDPFSSWRGEAERQIAAIEAELALNAPPATTNDQA